MEKEVRENPGEHKFVVPTASEQVEHRELPLRDDEEQHGRHGDRIRRGGPRDEQERRRLDDPHQGTQRRSHQDGAKTFPTRRGVLRLFCVGCAGTNQVAHRRTGSKEFADPGHFPQTRKRHHYPGRSRESHLGHEVGDKKHERGFEPRHLTGIILIPSDMIILKEKVAGYNNTLTLATKEMKFGINEEVNKVVRVYE